MLLTIMFVWLTVTDAPVRLDPPVFAERQRLQKSARSRPLYSLWKYVTTDSVEEVVATERSKYIVHYSRLSLMFQYGQAIPVLLHRRTLDYTEYSPELRGMVVLLIEALHDWKGEKLPHDWDEVRALFLKDGTQMFRGWDCAGYGVTPEWEWVCDQFSLSNPESMWTWWYKWRRLCNPF